MLPDKALDVIDDAAASVRVRDQKARSENVGNDGTAAGGPAPGTGLKAYAKELYRLKIAAVKSGKSDLAAKYPSLLADDTPEMLTVIRFRLHLFRYLSGLKGVSRMRGRLSTVRSLDGVRRAIDDCLDCESTRRSRRAELATNGDFVR